MSTATAPRPRNETRTKDLYEGLEEIRPEPISGESAEGDGRAEAWKVVQSRLLTELRETEVQIRFRALAEELEEAAAGLSATRRAMKLPAFNEILALGEEVVPEVIARLKTSDNRPLWLRVLGTLTPFPPGAGADTVDEAADAWIRWGRIAS